MSIPLCPRCHEPMPKLLGTILPNAVCQKCFNIRVVNLPKPIDEGLPETATRLNQDLLEIIKGKDHKRKFVACLALQLSIEIANSDGVFDHPTGLIKKALQTLYPSDFYQYHLVQWVRSMLLNQELWLKHGHQVKGRGSKSNQMKLGHKVTSLIRQKSS